MLVVVVMTVMMRGLASALVGSYKRWIMDWER